MRIYFDGVLIDTIYYAGLTRSASVFEDSFRLGKTICETYKLTLSKDANVEIPELVTIYQNEDLVKTLYVDNVTEDDLTTTYELIDAMVKFNFSYDASQLINQGTTTLLDIFEDICSKANISTDISTFNSSSMEVTWYDNTMSARTYLGFIGELNCSFFYITPDNKLAMKSVIQQPVDTISFDEISDYKIGTHHTISRVVYDNTYNKWEFGDDTGETYYVDINNVYIIEESQVETIYNTINGLDYYNFKSNNIPIEDLQAGDFITFTDGTNNYNTFMQFGDLNFSGDSYFGGLEIEIKSNEQEETEILDTKDIIKSIRVVVDRDKNRIDTLITETKDIESDLKENYYTATETNELVQNSTSGVTNTFSKAGGNNIFRNTGLWFETNDENNPYEFWTGVLSKEKEEKAVNMNAIILMNATAYQEQQVPNGIYTISFKYKKLVELATTKVYINDIEYELSSTDTTDFTQTINANLNYINVRFESDIDNSCEIYDLMVNAGEVGLAYSQNQNETTTDTVNISKGIEITSSDTETTFKADADGIRTVDKNGNILTEFTDVGMSTEKMVVKDTSIILNVRIQEVGEQTWFTRL